MRLEDFNTAPGGHGDTDPNPDEHSVPDPKSVTIADRDADPNGNAKQFPE
jgi:hypothetical protein